MYLIIDIGNSFQKAAVFSADGKMLRLEESSHLTVNQMEALFQDYTISDAIISTVGKKNSEIETYISTHSHVVSFSHTTPLPIRISYKQPETLGLDRIANSVAAHALFPDQDVLSIQAGTCLVMDFTTRTGEYLGGSISPGIDMRFAALNHFTANLPLVSKQKIDFLIGDTTRHSIESGVINGIIDEINGGIERYKQQFGEIKVVLTGGNKKDLQKSIKSTIFAASNLVAVGLYKILIFNVGEK